MSPARLSYEESCRLLMKLGCLDGGDSEGAVPLLPARRPRFDDELGDGVSFFRTWVGSGRPFGLAPLNPDDDAEVGGLGKHDLENLTLPRTFFGRSEVSRISFRNTDLSESTLCWNDFIEVDFTDAGLLGCDLRASLFTRTVFVRADMRGCDLRRSTFDECDFTDAELRGAKLTHAQGRTLVLSPVQRQVIDWQDSDGKEPPGG